jgi:hypothetical protein
VLTPDDQDGPRIIGIEPTSDHLQLHLAPLPHDERCAAAGLFGMRARPGWCAVALTLHGRARQLDTAQEVGRATAMVVVDQDGGVASTLRVDDAAVDGCPADDPSRPGPGRPEGLTVDAMHRMLGLPSPGGPPPTPLFTLAMWSQLLICHTLERGTTSWAEAVRLHPGHPGGGRVDASVETVVEATLRTEGQVDWQRLHRRGGAGAGPPDLSRSEARWMDPTMYSRWVLGSLPDPDLAAQVLAAHACTRSAEAVAAVSAAVADAVAADALGVARVGEPDANDA